MGRARTELWSGLTVLVCALALAIFGGCSSDDPATPSMTVDGGVDATPVTAANYTVKVTPVAVLVSPGSSVKVTVTIERLIDSTSSVAVTVSALPSGVTSAPVEIAEDSTSATLVLSASASATAGVTTVAVVDAASGEADAKADLEVTTTGPPPQLDSAFGTGGKTKIGAGVAKEDLSAVALQSDGKIVVAGSYRTGYTTVPAVARYLTTGGLDPAFGQGGVVLLDSHDSSSVVGVAIQGDGKILLLEPEDFKLTRLTLTGVLDTTFNATGVTSAAFPAEARGWALAVQPDGKIVVTGAVAGAAALDFALARILVDGTLDPGFGTGGRVTTPVVADDDVATAIALETNAATTVSIIAAGSALVAGARQAVAVRYLGTTGALDASFGAGGIATFSSGALDDLVSGVAVASGKVVVSGHRRVSTGTDLLQVIRFTPGGVLDPTFNATGVVTVGFAQNAAAHGMVVTGGKIVIAGEVGTTANQVVLARIDDTGALDNGFGTGGKVTSSFGDASAAHAIVAQTDGALVVVGSSTSGANPDALVARYGALSGALDTGFDADGKATSSFGPGDEELRAIALQPDGKIIAAGSAFNGRDFDFLVARVLPTGALDTTFGGGRGWVLYDHARASEFAYDVRVLGDNKILVGGQGGPGTLVLRLSPDGAIDASFGTAGVAAIAGGDGYGMSLQGAGPKIVVGGPSVDGNFFLARLTNGGVLDTSGTAGVGFGTTGTLTTDFGLADRAVTLAVHPDGKIVLVGHLDHGGPPNFFDPAIARYDSSGVLDNTFDGDGKMTFDTASVELLYCTAIQPDGRILVGGRMQRPGRATSMGVYRIATNGAVDTTFGEGGRARTDLQDGSQASAIFVEPSRMILIAGRSADDRIMLLRLSPSGAPIWPQEATTSIGSRSEAFALARQPDGRAIVAGVGHGRLEDQAVLVRYLP